jgi:predicted alpha/beta-fold hydrolase
MVDDLQTIVFLLKKFFPNKKIILIGESLGAALITRIIHFPDIYRLILINYVNKP